MKIQKLLNEAPELTNAQIKIMKTFGVFRYSVNEDGSIDIPGSVRLLTNQSDNKHSFPVKINKVYGDFEVMFGMNLSPINFPNEVTGNFIIEKMSVSNLKLFPKIVGGNYIVEYSELESLEGAPEIVDGSFSVGGNNLTTLEHGPKEVSGYYSASMNLLETLKGIPSGRVKDLNISSNPTLKVLDFLPNEIINNLDITNTEIKSFKDIHKKIKSSNSIKIPARMYTNSLDLIRSNIKEIVGLGKGDTPEAYIFCSILEKHIGQGRKGVLACQTELISSSYDFSNYL